MQKQRRDRGSLPGFAGIFTVALLTGCGASPTSPSSTAAAVSPNHFLAGNWLLFGSLPASGFSPSTQPGLAVSFDVTGSNVTGGANITTTALCGSSTASFSGSFGDTLTGTIASDGTFTLSTPSSTTLAPFSTLTVQGTVPASADAPWKGTYTYTSTSVAINNNPPCTVNQTGTFTAAAVQDVTGTYAGSGSFPATVAGSAPVPYAVSMSLQQGGTLYGPQPGVSVSSRLALSGSLQVQGFGCFSAGTTSTVIPSELGGNRVVANFVASDGTTAELSGSILDAGATRLSVETILVRGAQCNELYTFPANPLIVQR